MEKKIKITEAYLYLPIRAGQKEELFEVFAEEDGKAHKVFEFMIPVDQTAEERYSYDYLARFAVKQFTDKTLTLKGEVPEAFMREVVNASEKAQEPLARPSIHFTAERGWINDPNGLFYQDGVYHLYFQYNPFNTSWQNMSWGHAVSRDLLHWKQEESVLYPDEHGMMFSGCALINERKKLGLPEKAVLYFYTAAAGDTPWSKGKEFTQRIAYSTDGGHTLTKLETPYLDTICRENRDPKIFWHEESSAYIMALWLEGNDFALLRSENLAEWEMTDRFTLEKAWECPDLVRLSGQEGGTRWMFWSADGFYYWGEFDGYHFKTDGVQHKAYLNTVPYAAQIYAGVTDRVISVPWLRLTFEGRLYTGAMGIPRELSYREEDGETILIQRPVREFTELLEEIPSEEMTIEKIENVERICYNKKSDEVLLFQLEQESGESIPAGDGAATRADIPFEAQFGGVSLTYLKASGELTVDGNAYFIGKGGKGLSVLIDEKVAECWEADGATVGAFEVRDAVERVVFAGAEYNRLRLYRIRPNTR